MRRLRTRRQFQAVLAGAKVAVTAHFVLHRCSTADAISAGDKRSSDCTASKSGWSSGTDVWLGAVVPKRWAKHAVTRNSIKRQIYHVSSEFQSALPVAAHVVRLRAGFDKAIFVSASSVAFKIAVRKELMLLFLNAGKDSAPSKLAVPDQ